MGAVALGTEVPGKLCMVPEERNMLGMVGRGMMNVPSRSFLDTNLSCGLLAPNMVSRAFVTVSGRSKVIVRGLCSDAWRE